MANEGILVEQAAVIARNRCHNMPLSSTDQVGAFSEPSRSPSKPATILTLDINGVSARCFLDASVNGVIPVYAQDALSRSASMLHGTPNKKTTPNSFRITMTNGACQSDLNQAFDS